MVWDDQKFSGDTMLSRASAVVLLKPAPSKKESVIHSARRACLHAFRFPQITSGAAQFHESNHKPQQGAAQFHNRYGCFEGCAGRSGGPGCGPGYRNCFIQPTNVPAAHLVAGSCTNYKIFFPGLLKLICKNLSGLKNAKDLLIKKQRSKYDIYGRDNEMTRRARLTHFL